MNTTVKFDPSGFVENPPACDGTKPAEGARPWLLWKPSQFLAYTPDPSGIVLADGIIEAHALTTFVGIGGLGKSRLLLWLACCQIARRQWCGLSTGTVAKRWLLLSTENGVRRWHDDLSRMLANFSESEREAIDEHLLILALDPDNEDVPDMCLDNPDSIARLTATVSAARADVVGVDPWSDVIAGDENKAPDVVATLRTMRGAIRKGAPTAAIVVVAHARTGPSNVAQLGDAYAAGNFGRGSKALYSHARAEIQLGPRDRDDPTKLILACGKSNNAARFTTRGIVFDEETFAYEVDSDFDLEDWRNDVEGKRKYQSASVADVVEAVRTACPNPGDSVKTGEIVAAVKEDTGASVRTINARIGEAVKAGYLRKKERGHYALGSKPLKRR